LIDFHQLFTNLVSVVQSAHVRDVDTIADRLSLDVSKAKISKTKHGLTTIYGAQLGASLTEIDLLVSVTPRRELWLLFPNSRIPYEDVRDKTFGINQRIEQSKFSEGFAILFPMNGFICGLTAPGPNGFVGSVFCEEPRSARV
jgi:hypothetical protein